jgi:uncharacterized membrane protein YqjE
LLLRPPRKNCRPKRLERLFPREKRMAHALHEWPRLSTQPERPLHGVGPLGPGTGTFFQDEVMNSDRTLGSTASAESGLTPFEALRLRAGTMWTQTVGLVHDHALLALLEVQRASLGLVKIIGAAVVISVLIVAAWMGLVAAGIVWAVGAGASWGVAIVVAAVVNLVAAAALAFWIKAQVPELLFAATLRQLRGEPPADDVSSHAK